MQAGFTQLASEGQSGHYSKFIPTNLDDCAKASSLPSHPSKLSSSNDSLEHFSHRQLAVDDLLVNGARVSIAW